MSLITQCPACATMFRVVPDQLRISEGWVRCGQCEEVFDANAHLRTLDEVASGRAPAPEPDAAPAFTEDAPAPPLPASPPVPMQAPPVAAYDWGPVMESPEPPEPSSAAPLNMDLDIPSSSPAISPEHSHEPYPDEPALHEDSAPPPDVDALLAQSPHGQALEDASIGYEPVLAAVESVPMESDQALLSFMAANPAPTPARRRMVRHAIVALCVLLALVFALQVLVQERDRLAATAPALRPLLAGICAPLACRIAAPKQIEAIAIESSSFTSLKPGVYVLNVVLKNAAALNLTTPALELTLTDTQDQAIVRRVVEPVAFGAKLEILAGSELSASIPIQVITAEAVPKIAGYKLLAFYP